MDSKIVSKKVEADRFKENGVIIKTFPGYFLIAAIVISFFFFFKVLNPFITVLIFSAILATVMYPLYKWVLNLLKGNEIVASLLTCFIVLVFILVPILVFVILLGKQAFDAYLYIQHAVMNGAFDPYLKWEHGGFIYDSLGFVRDQVGGVVDFDSLNIRESITSTAQAVAAFLATQSAQILKSIGWLFINLFVLLFALFYLFKDGKKLMRNVVNVSPLPRKYDDDLIKKFKEISHAALYGIFLTAVAQGFIGGVGFAIVGIPSALFWGTAISIFSLVPVVGTATVWFPASVILIVTGNVWGGVFLFFYGLLIVSTVDNFLRAYLIGERAKMNQLMTFLAVFGGIWAFGLIGVVFGPLILTSFFAFLHIYEKEYSSVLLSKK